MIILFMNVEYIAGFIKLEITSSHDGSTAAARQNLTKRRPRPFEMQ